MHVPGVRRANGFLANTQGVLQYGANLLFKRLTEDWVTTCKSLKLRLESYFERRYPLRHLGVGVRVYGATPP